MLLGERPEMRYALSAGAGESSILLRRLTLSGVKWEDEAPTVTLTAEASVQSVDGNMTRKTLEAALLDELQRRLAALNTQMARTRSDLLGLSARAALCGHDLQNITLGEPLHRSPGPAGSPRTFVIGRIFWHPCPFAASAASIYITSSAASGAQ